MRKIFSRCAYIIGMSCFNLYSINLFAQEIDLVSTSTRSSFSNVASVNQNSCQKHNLVGLPVLNFGNVENAKVTKRAFSLCRIGYFSYFDPSTKTPLWVAENLNSTKVNAEKEERTENFSADPDVPKRAQATLSDYKGSHFDRGHMAPAADMYLETSDQDLKSEAMSESFYLTNMVPQVGMNMNRGIWADLEAQVRLWAADRENLLVVTGPIFDNKEQPVLLGRSEVWVPSRLYKVIYDPKTGANIAFILPNVQVITSRTRSLDSGNPDFVQTQESKAINCGSVCSLADFETTVAEVEKITGLQFFPTARSAKFSTLNTEAWPITR